MYDKGLGVSQDYHKAVEWYTKAAHQGDEDAQYELGVMYAEGKGVPQNKSTAKRYYGQACDSNRMLGCDEYDMLDLLGY